METSLLPSENRILGKKAERGEGAGARKNCGSNGQALDRRVCGKNLSIGKKKGKERGEDDPKPKAEARRCGKKTKIKGEKLRGGEGRERVESLCFGKKPQKKKLGGEEIRSQSAPNK